MLWLSGIVAVFRRAARLVSFFLCIYVSVRLFPTIPNHGYLLCIALLMGAMFDTDHPAEQLTLADGFRCLGAIVLFWSGVQKLLAGTWTHGQLLAYEIGHSSRFYQAFGGMISRAERHAFQTDGPFEGTTLLVVLSNATWILEIVTGLGLLAVHGRIRKVAAIVALMLLLVIELVARESVFGVLMVALLLPAADVRFRARWLWLVVPLELLAIAGRLSLVPGGFH